MPNKANYMTETFNLHSNTWMIAVSNSIRKQKETTHHFTTASNIDGIKDQIYSEQFLNICILV